MSRSKAQAGPQRAFGLSSIVRECIAAYEAADPAALASIEARLPAVKVPKDRAFLHKTLGLHALTRAKDSAGALRHLEAALQWDPHDVEAVKNIAVVLLNTRRFDDAARHLEQAATRWPDNFEIQDGLAHAYGRLDRSDDARRAGTRSLILKDRLATAPANDLSGVAVPAFDTAEPTRNIISFSLYGTGERYLKGAVRNAQAAPFIYPGWTCRFHVDNSVPRDVRHHLVQLGAQVVTVDGLPAARFGTSWRFIAASDPKVSRCLFRDCDSVINTQERVAVDEWIASGRHFHVMRDGYTHTELVLAGMWGAVGGALPDVIKELMAWMGRSKTLVHRAMDQWFLREGLWPTIRQSVLVHDSQFRFGETRPFPPYGRLPSGQHVGQNLFGA
jgi:hypothetical protein